mmetsp:Transcript_41312/g.47632  ORF Transcript_41312/g.47632 Transcript_41312/m.47632 type:complete len:127 (+) Transcript_41312:39-419(+)
MRLPNKTCILPDANPSQSNRNIKSQSLGRDPTYPTRSHILSVEDEESEEIIGMFDVDIGDKPRGSKLRPSKNAKLKEYVHKQLDEKLHVLKPAIRNLVAEMFRTKRGKRNVFRKSKSIAMNALSKM